MKVIEPGQDWKIAALRSAFHVHFLFGGNMKKEYLDLAFYYAEKAFQENEVPIGAVIVKNDEVISFGYNMKEKKSSVLEHAELIAIRGAEKKLQNWRLDDCDLYITLDPCPMCASAIKQARIRNVYSAVSNSDTQNDILIKKIFEKDTVNPGVAFFSNLDEKRSRKILNDFFKKQRIK